MNQTGANEPTVEELKRLRGSCVDSMRVEKHLSTSCGCNYCEAERAFIAYAANHSVEIIDRLQASLSSAMGKQNAQDEEIQRLRAELASMTESRAGFLRDSTDGMECLSGCDSYAHAELCPVGNPVAAWRKLRAELAEARNSLGLERELRWKDWSFSRGAFEAQHEHIDAITKELDAVRKEERCPACYATEVLCGHHREYFGSPEDARKAQQERDALRVERDEAGRKYEEMDLVWRDFVFKKDARISQLERHEEVLKAETHRLHHIIDDAAEGIMDRQEEFAELREECQTQKAELTRLTESNRRLRAELEETRSRAIATDEQMAELRKAQSALDEGELISEDRLNCDGL